MRCLAMRSLSLGVGFTAGGDHVVHHGLCGLFPHGLGDFEVRGSQLNAIGRGTVVEALDVDLFVFVGQGFGRF